MQIEFYLVLRIKSLWTLIFNPLLNYFQSPRPHLFHFYFLNKNCKVQKLSQPNPRHLLKYPFSQIFQIFFLFFKSYFVSNKYNKSIIQLSLALSPNPLFKNIKTPAEQGAKNFRYHISTKKYLFTLKIYYFNFCEWKKTKWN